MSIATKIGDYLSNQALQCEANGRVDVCSLLEQNSNARLLDCGCAGGETTLMMAKRIGTTHVSGIEVAEENIAVAKSNGVDVHLGNLNEEIPFQSESFDVVVASHVLEHLADTDLFVREIYRVLVPGGYVVVATPNLSALPHIMYLSLGKQPNIAEVSDQILVGTWSPRKTSIGRVGPAHRRLFTLGALNGLLEHYGFRTEETLRSGYAPLPTLLSKLACTLDKTHATNLAVKARKVI